MMNVPNRASFGLSYSEVMALDVDTFSWYLKQKERLLGS